VSARADDRSSRRGAIAGATEAVRAAHPESDERAETMLREQLLMRGVFDISEEAIAKVAPLSRRPRVVAGFLAAKTAVGTFWRLRRDLAGQAEPSWLTAPDNAEHLQPGPGQTARAAEVALDPAAAPLMVLIAAERPHEEGRVPFTAWLVCDTESSPTRVMAGQTHIGNLTGDDSDAARSSLHQAGTPLWTIARLYPSSETDGPAVVRLEIAESST
jgi:hypothetical protein